MAWEHTTFIYPDKSFAEVEVGDRKQSDFYPQVKIKRWDNECNFSARLKTEHKNPKVVEEGKKIKWKDGDVEAHFYELDADGEQLEEGGLEFEVVYHKKPKSNKVEFTIQSKGLDFFLQPHEDGPDTYRPENVKGSYAVYHKEKAHGRYKTGKAFHIYRPHVVDSGGNETYADLKLDLVSETLTIIVPQDFLDNAVYPVYVDPTLGYTTIGASNITYAGESAVGTKWTTPSGYSKEGYSLTMYCAQSAGGFPEGDVYIRAALWSSGRNILSQASKITLTPDDDSPAWRQIDWTPGSGGSDDYPTISPSTTYWIGGCFDNELNDSVRVWYDSGDTDQSLLDNTNNIDSIEDLSEFSYQDRKYSWYLTYAGNYDESATDGLTLSDSDPRIRTQWYRLVHDGAGAANQYFDLDYTVDPDHAFIITHVTGKDNNTTNTDANEWGIRARITADGTQIHLVRSQTNSDTVVSCQVVECFNEEFTVQRGSLIFEDVNSFEDVTITSVDETNSFITISAGARFSPEARADLAFVTGKFTSSTNMRIERGRTTDNGEDVALYWEVIEFNHPDISVQTGEVDCSGDISGGTTESISSVDTSRAWVHTQYRCAATSGNEAGYAVRTRLTSSTQLTIDRYTTLSKASYLRYWVVEWPEGVAVNRYAASSSLNNISPTVASYIEGQVLFDVNANSDDSTQTGVATVAKWCINALTDSTTIQMRRYITVDITDSEYDLQEIDFSGWRVGTILVDEDKNESASDGIEFSDTPTVIATQNTTSIDGVIFGELVVGGTVEDESAIDGVIFGDTPVAAADVGVSAADGVDFGDTPVGENTIEGTVAEGVDFGDIPVVLATIEGTPSDGVDFGDTTTSIIGFSDSVSDGVVFSELTYSFFGTMDYLTDGIELGDSTSGINALDESASDGIDFGDTSAVVATINGNLTDGIELGDGVTVDSVTNVSRIDGVIFGDSTVGAFTILDSASDGIDFGDTPIGANVIDRSLADGIDFGDSTLLEAIVEAVLTDGMEFREKLNVVLNAVPLAIDGILFGSEALPFRVFEGFAADTMVLGDTVDLTTDFVTNVIDGIVVGEILVSDLGGRVVYLTAKPQSYNFVAKDLEYSHVARLADYYYRARPARSEPANIFT